MTEKFLEIKGGSLKYKNQKEPAIKNIDFSIYRGEIMGLVGESGSGKTTVARILTQMETLNEGKLFLKGNDITKQKKSEIRENKKVLQYIFQDAKTSLNPLKKIGKLLEEPLISNEKLTKEKRFEKIFEVLDKLQIPKKYLDYYPRSLSGGQAQRIAIAAAILMHPEFIAADEIVSALDVSVQAGVLNLLMDMKNNSNMTILFITHDIRVCYLLSDRISVMYKGEIVEESDAISVYENPSHPYTKELLESEYSIYKEPSYDEFKIGEKSEKGCIYFDRCRYAMSKCKTEKPKVCEFENKKVKCFLYENK